MTLAGRARLGALAGTVLWLGILVPANAQDSTLSNRVDALTAKVKQQENRLEADERELQAARAALAKQQPATTVQTAQNVASTTTPTSPVGEAPRPEEQPSPQVIQSLPQGLYILAAPGHFILTPSVEYTTTSNDRLVYEGVVLVPGINIGAVDASTDDRNIVAGVADVRVGVFNRLELEVRLPYVYSDDRATLLSQGPNGSATQNLYLESNGIGDVEMAARYQINDGTNDWPIFLANLRGKSDTGLGPFDVSRNSAGIAQQVALGSGFWAVEGGFSMLKLTDPAVIYSSLNYVYSLPKDINQNIGGVLVGQVDPSNSILFTLGFGFAVNPELSFSLGYEHDYVMPQKTMLGGTQQATTALEVGAMTLGMAFRISPSVSINSNFEFGVTQAAPNVRAVFSVPISL